MFDDREPHCRVLHRRQRVRRIGNNNKITCIPGPGLVPRRKDDPTVQDLHGRLTWVLVLSQRPARSQSNHLLAQEISRL